MAQQHHHDRVLEQLRNVEGNENGTLVDAQGHPLPPCIVMERVANPSICGRPVRSRTAPRRMRCALSAVACKVVLCSLRDAMLQSFCEFVVST